MSSVLPPGSPRPQKVYFPREGETILQYIVRQHHWRSLMERAKQTGLAVRAAQVQIPAVDSEAADGNLERDREGGGGSGAGVSPISSSETVAPGGKAS